jgi:TadE-like protein
MRRHREARAQSTVEFALVLPLYVGCIALLFGMTVVCLQFLSLHDAARSAARAAVTSDNPEVAARSAVGDPHISLSMTEAGDLITVTAERKSGLWWFSKFLPSPLLAQSVTMMREAPIVLG